MKTKLLVVIALLLVTILSLSSCRLVIGVVDFVQDIINPKIELTDAPLEAEKIIDFANGANPDVLFESDGWSNGDVFNVVWKKHNVFYGDGIMRLGITEEKATAWIDDAEVEYSYTAGEARTQNYYHYGDYEVSMKPSANPGTASTFFRPRIEAHSCPRCRRSGGKKAGSSASAILQRTDIFRPESCGWQNPPSPWRSPAILPVYT